MAASNYDVGAATEILRRLRNVTVDVATDGVKRWTVDGDDAVDSTVCDLRRGEYWWLLVLMLGLPIHPLQLLYLISFPLQNEGVSRFNDSGPFFLKKKKIDQNDIILGFFFCLTKPSSCWNRSDSSSSAIFGRFQRFSSSFLKNGFWIYARIGHLASSLFNRSDRPIRSNF